MDERPAKASPVLIPVTAEDVARRKRHVRIWVLAIVVVLVAGAGYLYKRSVDPIHARQSYDAGMRLYGIARYPQAILAFERAFHLDPAMVDAEVMLGRCYLADSKIDRAIAEFGKAIEMRPADLDALLWRGRSWLELKDYQAAIRDANRALAVDSRFAVA